MSVIHKQVYERVLKTIRDYGMLERGDLVLVGVSGGVDSLVLLILLHRLQARLDIRLHVAHLNHQFRGAEAERDAEHVRQIAERLELPCTIESRDVPERIRQDKLSPQDAARQERYLFFEACANQIAAHKIATAHHADDQAETVLLALLRGASLHGLGGIQPMKGRIIRPLLDVTRQQIEAFAQSEQITYVVDSSNTNRKYRRNAVRLDLLPFLQQHFNPAIVTRLTEYAQFFREDAFFIDKIARQYYKQLCEQEREQIIIDLNTFTQQERTIQREIVSIAFQELTGTRHQLETNHIQAVLDVFTQHKTGSPRSLPCRVIARREYDRGFLQRMVEKEAKTCQVEGDEVSITIPGRTVFHDVIIDTEILPCVNPDACMKAESFSQTVLRQQFDYDCLAFPIIARFRRAGDHFRPLGMAGNKTLKKFFIDRKVIWNKRHSIPLLTDRNGILWIMGYEIDDRVRSLTRQDVY